MMTIISILPWSIEGFLASPLQYVCKAHKVSKAMVECKFSFHVLLLYFTAVDLIYIVYLLPVRKSLLNLFFCGISDSI